MMARIASDTTKRYADQAFNSLSLAMRISELFESCKIGAVKSQFPIKCAILKLRFTQNAFHQSRACALMSPHSLP